jgi:adenosylcobinamide amidohydrolase
LKIDTPIKNLLVEVKNDTLVIGYNKPFKVMSSAVLNGGLKQARTIISCHVPENYDHKNPEEMLQKKAEELKLPSPLVGMLTAVDLRNVSTSTGVVSGKNLLVVATAGTSNATRPGEAQSTQGIGTINLVVVYEGDMTESCMVNVVLTVTEAKSATLRRLDIRTRKTGILATGTSTDTVAICCLGDGKPLRYAGSATEIGNTLGRTVESSIQESLRKQEGLMSGRPMAARNSLFPTPALRGEAMPKEYSGENLTKRSTMSTSVA